MARFSKRRTTMRNDVMDGDDRMPAEIDNDEQHTLLSAVCQVVEVVRGSHNDPRIYEAAARPIAYIKDLLGLTERQVVAYAIVMDMYYDWVCGNGHDHAFVAERVGLDLDACHDDEVNYTITLSV